jgi:hypothetical protein
MINTNQTPAKYYAEVSREITRLRRDYKEKRMLGQEQEVERLEDEMYSLLYNCYQFTESQALAAEATAKREKNVLLANNYLESATLLRESARRQAERLNDFIKTGGGLF